MHVCKSVHFAMQTHLLLQSTLPQGGGTGGRQGRLRGRRATRIVFRYSCRMTTHIATSRRELEDTLTELTDPKRAIHYRLGDIQVIPLKFVINPPSLGTVTQWLIAW